MSDNITTRLDPNGGPGWYMPVAEDGTQYPDQRVLVSEEESHPEVPTMIDGKKIVDWILIPD